MSAYNAIKSLKLRQNSERSTIADYTAEVAFGVSFGTMGFNLSGSLTIDADAPLSVVYDFVLDAAFEKLNKTPFHFELVSRYLDWEGSGRPPYAVWCATNYPDAFS